MLIAVRRGNDQKSMEGAPLNDECFNPDNLCSEVHSARLCINSCNNSTEIPGFFFLTIWLVSSILNTRYRISRQDRGLTRVVRSM